MNDTDLTRLDSILGDGPAMLPVDVHVRSARRALLRRRAAAGVGAVALLAATGTGVAVALPTPDGAEPRVVEAAGDPTPPSEERADASRGEDSCPREIDEEPPSATGENLPDVDPSKDGVAGCPVDSLVWLTDDGRLILGEGVRLLERIADPFGLAPDVAIELLDRDSLGRVVSLRRLPPPLAESDEDAGDLGCCRSCGEDGEWEREVGP